MIEESAGAVRDARASRDEANNRAATYRAALIEVREYLAKGSEGEGLINRVLAPAAEPRVWIAAHVEHPALRYHRDPKCAQDAANAARRVAAFVARMVGAEPCEKCSEK